MSRYDKKQKRALAMYASIFLLLVLGIAIGGHLSYQNFEQEFHRQAGKQVSAIAELKANDLAGWRRERLIDAQSFYHNEVFAGLVERYFENPADTETRKQIISRLEYYQSYANYDGICLLDVTGKHRLVIPDNSEEFKQADALMMTQAVASLDSGDVVFVDFQRDENVDGKIYISILVPLFADQGDGHPLGVLVLHINPETYLYPYITQWPIPSDTAETLLVRRDGADVLFLNQLRFEPNAAMNLRFPLTRTDLPSVKAVLGQTGLVEGTDYRGKLVLADIRSIPDSPWFLVSKVDVDEVYAPLRQRLWQTMLIVGLAILVAAFGLITVWRQQRLLFYRTQVETAGALRESEDKFRKAFVLSPDSININRLHDGMYVSVNNGFTKIMGYTAEEVIGKTSLELNVWVDPQDRKALVDGLTRTGTVENLEARFRAKNGEIIYGLMSASLLELNGVPHLINITRDVTERRRVQEALRESEERFRSLYDNTIIGLYRTTPDGRILMLNPTGIRMLGFDSFDELAARNLEKDEFQIAHTRSEFRKKIESDDFIVGFESMWRKKDCSLIFIRENARVFRDEAGVPLYYDGSFEDVTERKLAEDALRQSEENLSTTLHSIGDGVISTDKNGLIVNMNPMAEKYCGWSLTDARGKALSRVFNIVDAETRKKVDDPVEKVITNGQIVGLANHTMLISKTGDEYQISDSAAPIKDKNGGIIGVVLVFSDVTEKYKATEKLRESEANFSDMFQTVSEGIAYTSLDGKVLSINKSLEQIIEIPKEQVLGRNILSLAMDLLSAKNIGSVFPVLTRLIQGSEIQPFEVEYRNKILEISTSINRNSGRLTGVVRDITERRRTERVMQDIIEKNPMSIQVVDVDGFMLTVNSAHTRLFGAVPPLDYSIFHDDQLIRQGFGELLQRVKSGEVVYFPDMKYNAHDLSPEFPDMPVWVRAVVFPLTDGFGKPVRFVLMHEDVTARKKAEEALQESEVRFRTLFEQAAVGVAQLDTTTGRFMRINQKYCTILGYTHEEMLALDFQTITHPDDLVDDLANMQKLVAGDIREFCMEKRYYRKDGSIVWVSLTVSPLWAAGELPNAHIAIVEDITTRKQAEEALEKRIVALTRPLENTENITFTDLFSLEDIQKMQDDFAKATGVASIITQVDGTPITTPSNFCRLCNDIIRATPQGYINCCRSDAALGKLNPKGSLVQPCLSGGLWDAGAGISVGGKHIANWLIGQVRDETQTEDKMLEYAGIIGVDKQLFLEAFHEVPAMSRERFEKIANALFTLASQLSNMAYQNIQQARFIADRRQAEEALRESRALFHSLVESMPQNVFSKDLDGRFIFANQNYCADTGRTLAELIGKTDFDLHPVELAQQYRIDDRLVIEAGKIIEKVEIHQLLGGEKSYVQVSKAPIYDAEGQVKGMLGVFWDVTDRKRAEEALRESEQLYRKMNQNSPLGMHFYKLQDEKLIFTGANPAADKLLGVENSQFIGKTIEEAFPSLIQTEVPQRYREAAANGIPWLTEQIDYEDGQIKGAFEVKAFQTTPQNMVAIFADITIRKQAEDKILNLNAELEQRVRERTLQLENTNKELEAFSYSVSHDLRAPLRGIDGWSQALWEDYQDQLDEQGQEYIERVRSETQRMGRLIDDMLQLSRLTRADMVRESVDLGVLAQSIVERLKTDDPHRQVEFVIQPGIIARGDSHLLEAVFINLLGNAFKFTSKREQALIEFGQTDIQGQRVFFVRDNGVGFDMSYAQKLFGAFQRMHKASEFPGTGVGLAIVQRIIRRHGGRIWAEAQVGHGATFYFTLEEVN